MSPPKIEAVTHEVLLYKLDNIAEDIIAIRGVQSEHLERIEGIEKLITRYTGFAGGMLFVLTGIWFAIKSFGSVLIGFIEGK